MVLAYAKYYLDKIDSYDLYSGLALGALEINFGFLIYKFLEKTKLRCCWSHHHNPC